MQNFRILPWFQNIPCYQAILHQILLVRLLVELWSNGPGRHRDVGDLERNLASQRVAEGLQTASFTRTTGPGADQTPNDVGANVRKIEEQIERCQNS